MCAALGGGVEEFLDLAPALRGHVRPQHPWIAARRCAETIRRRGRTPSPPNGRSATVCIPRSCERANRAHSKRKLAERFGVGARPVSPVGRNRNAGPERLNIRRPVALERRTKNLYEIGSEKGNVKIGRNILE